MPANTEAINDFEGRTGFAASDTHVVAVDGACAAGRRVTRDDQLDDPSLDRRAGIGKSLLGQLAAASLILQGLQLAAQVVDRFGHRGGGILAGVTPPTTGRAAFGSSGDSR